MKMRITDIETFNRKDNEILEEYTTKWGEKSMIKDLMKEVKIVEFHMKSGDIVTGEAVMSGCGDTVLVRGDFEGLMVLELEDILFTRKIETKRVEDKRPDMSKVSEGSYIKLVTVDGDVFKGRVLEKDSEKVIVDIDVVPYCNDMGVYEFEKSEIAELVVEIL